MGVCFQREDWLLFVTLKFQPNNYLIVTKIYSAPKNSSTLELAPNNADTKSVLNSDFDVPCMLCKAGASQPLRLHPSTHARAPPVHGICRILKEEREKNYLWSHFRLSGSPRSWRGFSVGLVAERNRRSPRAADLTARPCAGCPGPLYATRSIRCQQPQSSQELIPCEPGLYI